MKYILPARFKRVKNDETGAVLVMVMILMGLMLLSTAFLATMIRQQTDLVRRTKDFSQAQYMAEAGISHALAVIKNESYAAKADFNNSLDTGSYVVTHATVGGRDLITSTGTANGVSREITAEIENLLPSALFCISAAGNDIRINALIAGPEIGGDIHANNNVYLKSGPLIATLEITGKVSATGIVQEGTKLHETDGFWGAYLDHHVYVNGVNDDDATVYEGEDRVVFPVFNYDRYEEEAEDSGDYYEGDQVFDGVTLSPGNGIVFVNGSVSFEGNCTINGGIIADDIMIVGTLTQVKTSHNRNVIIARDGDIGVLGRIETEEAVVYAGNDIRSLQVWSDMEINGILMARRDIYMWNFLTVIDYNYVESYPADIGDEDDPTFRVVSWNR
jgi:hypothetical protein